VTKQAGLGMAATARLMASETSIGRLTRSTPTTKRMAQMAKTSRERRLPNFARRCCRAFWFLFPDAKHGYFTELGVHSGGDDHSEPTTIGRDGSL